MNNISSIESDRLPVENAPGTESINHPLLLRVSASLRGLPLAAFSLVEIIIALGIFSFVIVAIMGTMTVALNSTRDSEMKLRAAHAVTTIIGTLKASPTNITDPIFANSQITNLTNVSTNTPETNSTKLYVDRQGHAVTSLSDSNAAFRLSWKLTRDSNLTNLVFCNLELSWPPGAASNSSSYRMATSVLLP